MKRLILIALLAGFVPAWAQAQTNNDVKVPAGADVVQMDKATHEKAQADRQATKTDNKPSVIIVKGIELYVSTQSFPSFPCDGTGHGPWGFFVQNDSLSSNVTASASVKLPFTYWQGCQGRMTDADFQYIPLAQYLADRLADGYTIIGVSSDTLTYTLVKVGK